MMALRKLWRAICKWVPVRRLVCAYLLKWLQRRCEHGPEVAWLWTQAAGKDGKNHEVRHCGYCGALAFYVNAMGPSIWYRPMPTCSVETKDTGQQVDPCHPTES